MPKCSVVWADVTLFDGRGRKRLLQKVEGGDDWRRGVNDQYMHLSLSNQAESRVHEFHRAILIVHVPAADIGLIVERIQWAKRALKVKEALEERWMRFQMGKTWRTDEVCERGCVIVAHIVSTVVQYGK